MFAKYRWKLAKKIAVVATNFSYWLLRNRKWKYDESDYRNLPDGTVGKELIKYMDKTGIKFKPNLVKHDIKHIITGYQMKTKDEIRIHAFLVGNKCTNWFSVLYLLLNVMILPELINELLNDYKRGKKATCLRKVNIEELFSKHLSTVQTRLNLVQN